MDDNIGFGFVGAGEIAVTSASALRGVVGAHLARVTDARTDLAAGLTAEYGGEPASSLSELLADPSVRAVYICTPHAFHREQAALAARAGKHVFVEKPMGTSPADAWAIVETCRRHGVACGVPFVARYAPAYQEAWRLVQAGAIGAITGFRSVYRGDKPRSYWSGGYSGRAAGEWRQHWATAGGGVLLMNSIHDLDALLWITGLEVEQVRGSYRNVGSPGEVEDVGHAILSCAGGALGTVEAHAALPGGDGPGRPRPNRIYGSAGQIVLPTPWGNEPLALFTRETGAWREIAPEATGDTRRAAFAGFVDALAAGRELPVPGEAGARAASIIHAIYESARRDATVAPARAMPAH
jgi:predicted dehydrogenase